MYNIKINTHIHDALLRTNRKRKMARGAWCVVRTPLDGQIFLPSFHHNLKSQNLSCFLSHFPFSHPLIIIYLYI